MRISRDRFLMGTAKLAQQRSTCLRLRVGAVVAREGRILVTGYNGAPKGMPHCTPETCNPSTPCRNAAHAEGNCVSFAAKLGISLDDTTLYTTDSPCDFCAKLIINAGIVEIVFEREYRDQEPMELLHEAGIIVRRVAVLGPEP
jgi:dCMP deaminase